VKIGVIGISYVGLVTAACLAKCGHQVIGADLSEEKIAILSSGGTPIWEPGLDEVLFEARVAQRIRFTTHIVEAVQQSEVVLVAVGTPSQPSGMTDLTQVWSAVDMIAKYGQPNQCIVIKNTVPVGTTDEIWRYLKRVSSIPFMDVVHNPEFSRQGQAVHDFLFPDRIVVGLEQEQTKQVMHNLYKMLGYGIQFCDRKSAEMIQYAANTYLAMKISYINMFAQLCEQVGGNIDDIAKGMGADPRIGPAFLQTGIGYGGSCFPKDTNAMLSVGKQIGLDLPLIQATDRFNTKQPERFVERLESILGGLNEKKVTLLGLSFKPNTDDLHEAPSIQVSQLCLERGAEVHAYDPLVKKFPISEVVVHQTLDSSLQQSDIALIVTDWEEFRQLDWAYFSASMKQPILFDGRNIFHLEEIRYISDRYGIVYHSIGRPSILPQTTKAPVAKR
jgi:UDPglucose 6-dehydrogenase